MSRVIKKYKNRRLYDTEISQYITLEELLRYVVDGIVFHVEDSRNNNDITNVVLLQIFVEMESGASKFLSSDMLRQLIIAAHHPMHQWFKEMLEKVFKVMEKPIQNDVLLKDYQEITDSWQKNMQQTMKHWSTFLKK